MKHFGFGSLSDRQWPGIDLMCLCVEITDSSGSAVLILSRLVVVWCAGV